MDTLAALVMTIKALENQHLSLTIRPHSYRLSHMAHGAHAKTRGGRCSGCSSF